MTPARAGRPAGASERLRSCEPPPAAPPSVTAARARAYRLREAGWELAVSPTVAACGRCRVSESVQVVRCRESGRAWLRGLARCASPWACATCARTIAAARIEELEGALARHVAAGGGYVLLTLTARHRSGQELRPLYRAVSRAWASTRRGRPWDRIAARLLGGVVGSVRAAEVTHGPNGWHPHLHVLLLTIRPVEEEEAAELREWIARRYVERVARETDADGRRYAYPSLRRAVVVTVPPAGQAAAYVAGASASGIAAETAGGVGKEAAGPNRTPWRILADWQRHRRPRDAWLWRSYCQAMAGYPSLRWSRGLRALLGIEEREDVDLLEEGEEERPGEEVVADIPSDAWDRLVLVPGLCGALVRAAGGGGEAVRAVLARARERRARAGPRLAAAARRQERRQNRTTWGVVLSCVRAGERRAEARWRERREQGEVGVVPPLADRTWSRRDPSPALPAAAARYLGDEARRAADRELVLEEWDAARSREDRDRVRERRAALHRATRIRRERALSTSRTLTGS